MASRRRRQHLDGHARAGRLDDHPAARQEPLEAGAGRHALAPAQDHRGRARLPGRAALVEAEDPRGVPQHDLLRPPGLRRRGRRRGVLRRAREGPAAAAGRPARRHSCRTRRTTTRSGTRRRPSSGARSCSASCCSRATSTPSSTASPTPSRCCRAGRPIGFPPEKKTIANYFVDYVRQQLINLYGPPEGPRRRAARLHDAQPAHAAAGAQGRARDAAEAPARGGAGRDQPAHRRGQGDGRRPRLHEHRLRQVQPRDRGGAPAGLVVQDLRAAGGARGGHPAADASSSRTSSRSSCRAGRSGRCRTTRAPTAG